MRWLKSILKWISQEKKGAEVMKILEPKATFLGLSNSIKDVVINKGGRL